MKFTFSDTSGHLIRSYEPGRLQVKDTVYTRSVVITAAGLMDWDIDHPSALTATALRALLEHSPEVVLLGTGETQRFPPAEVRRALIDAGVGLEIMSTGAAVRTFNVLVSEDRRVVAALIV